MILRELLAAAVLLTGLTGCTASKENPGAAATTAAATQDPCGTAADTEKQHLSRSEVVRVKVEGQCTSLVIEHDTRRW